jgi:hypothetical protein
MNRPLILTGVALGAAVTLAGCGGGKKAATVGHTASPRARQHAPTATRAPAATATVPGTVKVGGFCKAPGSVGKTTGGAVARCEKKPGDKRARWYSQAPAHGAARAGQYCSPAGSTAKSSTGAKLTCTKKKGENRARWHTK